MSEQLGKYIQLENDEQAGAKKGYIQDENVARLAADTEAKVRAKGGSPEEANRAAEKAIAVGIAGEEVKEELGRQTDRLTDYLLRKDLRGETITDHERKETYADVGSYSENAASNGNLIEGKYKEFQKNLDQEKLDELRRQIREEQK